MRSCVASENERRLGLLEKFRDRCFVDGDLYSLSTVDGVLVVSQVLQGNVSKGICLLEDAIARREKEGYRRNADCFRFSLSECIYKLSREMKNHASRSC